MKTKFPFLFLTFALGLLVSADEVTRGGWVGNTEPANGPLTGGVYENHNAPPVTKGDWQGNTDPQNGPLTAGVYENHYEPDDYENIGSYYDNVSRTSQTGKTANDILLDVNKRRADQLQYEYDKLENSTMPPRYDVNNPDYTWEDYQHDNAKHKERLEQQQVLQNEKRKHTGALETGKVRGAIFSGITYGYSVAQITSSSLNCKTALEDGNKELFINEFNKAGKEIVKVVASLGVDAATGALATSVAAGSGGTAIVGSYAILIGGTAVGFAVDGIIDDNLDLTAIAEIAWQELYQEKQRETTPVVFQENKEEPKPVKINKHSVY